jgi:uncharacterized membrane protein YphA (DoxX/SURF4 family)
MDFIQTLHSIIRWLIVAVAVVAMVRFALGWQRRMAYQSMDRGLMSAFAGLMDLQLVFGLILFFGRGVVRFRIEHAVTMIVAIVIAHLAMRWRNAEDALRFRNNLIAVAGALLIIIAGVAVLPQGWFG